MIPVPSRPLFRGVVAIVPAYNEEQSIVGVIRDLKQHCPGMTVVVVDDGSTDNMMILAGREGVVVLSLPYRRGIGMAMRRGFLWALEHTDSLGRYYDVAVQVDGDGQHPAAEVWRMLAPVRSGEVDVAIGSRYLGIGGYRCGYWRMVGIRILRLANWLLTRQWVSDPSSGFRAYNREAVYYLVEHYPPDYPEPPATIWLIRRGYRVREVGVSMRARQGGVSSIRGWRCVWYVARVLWLDLLAWAGRI